MSETYSYYYFDYNESFDNKETDSGWDNYGSSETQYFGYNRIHKDGIAPFRDTQNNHFIFGYSSYDVNSPTGDFSAYSYEYGVGTPGNINAGRYSYTVKFGGRDDGMYDFYRNTTDTKNDSWELGENYTFQNQVKGRPTNIIVSRKNSNAFTFDTTSTGPFGTTQLNDTAGNSIANPRWGFTNLKLVVKVYNDNTGNATDRISEFYMLTDTELILKITPTFEQNWKIQENTGFWKIDNNGTIFNSAVANLNTSNTDTTSTEQAAAETEATSSGISIDDINVFKTGTFTVSNGKSTLDNTRKAKILQLMQAATDASDKRKKRRAALKLLFSQETTLKKMVVPKADLDLPSAFTKTNALVIKAGETFNINDLGADEGFYSVLNNGETFAVTTENTTLTFTRADVGDNELYEVSAADWTGIVINSDNVATGTFTDSNNTGTLAPDDSVTIDGRVFIIGSIADGGGSGGSAGDPYVFPIKSSIPVKLPNKNAFYRMFEQGNNYINVEVGEASESHKQRMFNYARNITPITHNIVMDGYFYQKAFISAEGHKLTLDYNTKKVKIDQNSLKFFKIKQSKKIFDCGEFNEDAKCWNVGWTTKENKKIQVELMFFPNPHIENGINIIPSTLKKSTGLIVDNYKPKLMELPSLTKEKFNKLHRRLAKSKNRYQNLSIKSKNEKWHFN